MFLLSIIIDPHQRYGSLTKINNGLLTIQNGNQHFTVCGINRNFGATEARLFCEELLCEKASNPRIIEGFYVPGAPIGGFKNMKCPSKATSLANCTDVYPYDNERCTPNDNIGLLCSSDPDVIDPYPDVYCDEHSLSLVWPKNVHPNIKPEFVSILENGENCKNTRVDESVTLSVDYTNCGMVKEGENDTIIYSFQAKRMYPKLNNKIILKNDQYYKVSCVIARNNSYSEATYSISSVANLPLIANNTPIATTMTISTNNRFQPILSNIKNVDVGKEIFVKVQLMQPPSQLVPFLDNCFIESGNHKEYLIVNKCPVIPNLVISPLDSVTIMFSFKSFAILNINQPASIRCSTSICNRGSPGCIPTCQKTD